MTDDQTTDLLDELVTKLSTEHEPERPRSGQAYDSDPRVKRESREANEFVAKADPENGRLDSPTKGRHEKESVRPSEFMEQVAGVPGSSTEDLRAPQASPEERRLTSGGTGRLGERKGKKISVDKPGRRSKTTGVPVSWTLDELILIELRQERERRGIGCLQCGGKVYNKTHWLCRRHYDWLRKQMRRSDLLV